MVKRMLSLAAVALVLAVPAALADNGRPQAGGPAPSANARAHGGRGRDVGQRLERLRDELQKVGSAFDKHCTGGKDAARCTAAANKILAGLQRVDARLGTVIAKVQQRCGSGATTQAVPKLCARASQIVQKLQDVQSRVGQLEQKLQTWLSGHAPSGGSTGTTGVSSSPAPAGDAGLESLSQLQADLAAVQAQTGN